MATGDATAAEAGRALANVSGGDLREFRAAVENSFGAVVITDTDGVIEYVNPSFEELTGRRACDVVGRHARVLGAGRELEQSIGAALAAGDEWCGEIKGRRPAGEEYCMLASIQPLRSDDGEVTHYIGVNIDITERMKVEEELQRLREATEAVAEEGVKRASGYGLTVREITVLSLIARGKSDKEIAALLGLSPFTVNKHSSNLVRKLGARSRTEAAARAVREGII